MSHDIEVSLWAAYHMARTDATRNAIAEYYLHWAIKTTREFARSFGLVDPSEAVGAMQIAMLDRIIPAYDGQRRFVPYAATCIRRLVLSQLRRQKRQSGNVSIDVAGNRDGLLLKDCLSAPPEDDDKVHEQLAGFPARERAAAVLRYLGAFSIIEIARLLHSDVLEVERLLENVHETLRKRS